jgi:hypothetical protein
MANYQEAVAVPILFELAQGGVSIERGYSDTDYFHEKVVKWLPAKYGQLAGETITDGTQTKLYNSIRQGVRKLAKWKRPPIDWDRRKRLEINDAGLSYLQRCIIVAMRMKVDVAEAEVDAISKLSSVEFAEFVRRNSAVLRPLIMSYVRAMHGLR